MESENLGEINSFKADKEESSVFWEGERLSERKRWKMPKRGKTT